VARKTYASGIKPHPDFLANEPTQRDTSLSAYNYKFSAN
jgi:hypothetical protein